MSLVPGQGQYAVPRSNPKPPLASHHLPTLSLAQLRPRRHPRRCALASWRERVAQGTHRRAPPCLAVTPCTHHPHHHTHAWFVPIPQTARDSMVSLECAALPLKPTPCVATRPSADPSPLPCAGWPSTRRWSTRRPKQRAAFASTLALPRNPALSSSLFDFLFLSFLSFLCLVPVGLHRASA